MNKDGYFAAIFKIRAHAAASHQSQHSNQQDMTVIIKVMFKKTLIHKTHRLRENRFSFLPLLPEKSYQRENREKVVLRTFKFYHLFYNGKSHNMMFSD